MHTVAVLALDQVIPFDLSTPIEAFSRARLPGGRPGYRIRVCAQRPEIDAGAFTLRAPWGLDGLQGADTIIVPGTATPFAPLPGAVRDALRAAAAAGTRMASICSGAFPLAATGLLDGLRVTTHWILADRLAADHPRLEVAPDVLYVDNGQFLTSAGAAAGLDLCLHLIRRDYGSAVAADAARLSVMPLEREGGQAQFIAHDHQVTPRGRRAGAAARLAPGQPRPHSHPRRHLRPGQDEHPYADPPLPRADRHDTAAVAAPRPHPAGAAPAGDHPPSRRAHRRAGRLRLADRLPRPLQEDDRRQPQRLPAGLRLMRPELTCSGAWAQGEPRAGW
ncbi:GlxA family transcriptional regulator [Nonomuraea fuscirosea]|uniref:GlxA family transcriptional regulator n=1 Tax=Nonomuraea fuscirosea TaxID=1291556 RepID=UPI003F4E2DB5